MKIRILLLVIILLACAAAPAPLSAQKLKAEDVVAKHLQSVGPAETRAGVKSRLAQGTVLMQVVVGGSADLGGTIEVASLGHDSVVGMEFGHSAYQRERVICKEGAVEVARVNPTRRSDLGNFLYAKSHIVSEGLLGGALSTAWSLLDTQGRTPKLKYDGIKKVDGRQLHVLRYTPKKRGNELEITLYFDAEFHHVKTVYYFNIPPAIGAGAAGASSQSSTGRTDPNTGTGSVSGRDESPEVTAARLQESRFRLEEEFSDFQTVQGLTMPSKWKIRLVSDAQNSRVWEWQAQFDKIENNADVGPGAFTIKQ
jgi:hypothetical protein